MSDHLPECPVPELDGLWGLPLHPEDAEINCICDRLRACEQRVREETVDADWSEIGQLAAVRLFRKQAYVAGLDAAREAVKAGCGWRPAGRCSECTHATAAIEALSDTMRPDAATQ